MSFADLSDFFDDALHLPIDGVVYHIPAPDHEFGLYVTALVTAGNAVANGQRDAKTLPKIRFEGEDGDDESEEAVYFRRLLGDAYQALRDDNVSWPRIRLVAETATLWIAAGETVAEAHWNSGGSPKARQAALQATQEGAPAPNRAARRARKAPKAPHVKA